LASSKSMTRFRPGCMAQSTAAARGPSVIVNLAGLAGIGYSGLPVLLRIRKWARQSGGDLPLAVPQQPVRWILEATGLTDHN
jgi:anti-anti-sigma factor